MKVIIWIFVIWVVISCVVGMKSGELDMNPFVREIKDHPIITIIVILIILGIIF